MTACCRPRCGGWKLLEDENVKLKRIVADLSLDKEMLQDAIRRKL
jgi:putative transposase